MFLTEPYFIMLPCCICFIVVIINVLFRPQFQLKAITLLVEHVIVVFRVGPYLYAVFWLSFLREFKIFKLLKMFLFYFSVREKDKA